MGDPKKQRRKYETPRFPWRTDTLQKELNLIGQYGLRNKRELWRHETALSKFRKQHAHYSACPPNKEQNWKNNSSTDSTVSEYSPKQPPSTTS